MSSYFLSDGADPFSHLRPHLTSIPAAEFEGFWSCVEYQPNLFSPQRFIIGIVVGYPDGSFIYRLISDSSKFECVYGKQAASTIKQAIQSAEHSFLRLSRDKQSLKSLEFESTSLSISEPWPTSGRSPEQAITRLFNDVVAMEPSNEKKPRDFVSMDTHQVRQLVHQELKRIAGMRFEKIVVDPYHIIKAEDNSGEHVLEFNLLPEKRAGSVLSAVYKTPDTVELNLLRSSRDLATYARIRKVNDLALFIMTAKQEQYTSGAFENMRELIDEQSWRLERQGFRIVVFDEPLPIAQSILEWAAVPE